MKNAAYRTSARNGKTPNNDRVYTVSVEVIKADYCNERNRKEISLLLDQYARDPMGGGRPLEEYVIENVAKELSRIPHAYSVICYVDNQPAGLINCFEVFSTFACKPVINIHDVIVLKEFRGLGLSHKMLKKVEETAIEKGCCKLTLEVLSKNEIAKSSYGKFGFSAYELDPDSGQALFWDKKIETS